MHGTSREIPFTARERKLVNFLLAGKQFTQAVVDKAALQSARELLAKMLEEQGMDGERQRLAALKALLKARGKREIYATTIEALKAWTCAREAIVFQVFEGAESASPRVARGVLENGGALSISPDLMRTDALLRAHVEGHVVCGKPILAALRLGEWRWLILLLDAECGQLDPDPLVSSIVALAELQGEAIAAKPAPAAGENGARKAS